MLADAPLWLQDWARNRHVKSDLTNGLKTERGEPPAYLRAEGGQQHPDITARLADALRMPWSPQEEARLRSALSFIPAGERNVWLRVGMAIHQAGWEPRGFIVWQEWSRSTPEKYDEADQKRTWERFEYPSRNGRLVTLASVFQLAKQHGWTGYIAANSVENEGDIRATIRGDKSDDVPAQASSDKVLIDELANLSVVAYGRRRKDSAKQLGIGVAALDKAVNRRRTELEGEPQDKPLFTHWMVEPWSESVDGDALILELLRRIRSHVVMRLEAALTVALWIIFAWVHEETAIHSPILMVTSPEAECGKSTLLGLIGFLVPRSLPSVGISPAALYRSIEKFKPTLIIDEADAAFVQNEDLRSVVNSGWTRGQGVLRCDGDDNEPRLFSTFCPKAIGLKGKRVPDTTASRALVIELTRKLANENSVDFRHIDDRGLQELRQQLLRWSIDNMAALSSSNPALPPDFANRIAANWHLLLSIADVAGGEWPEQARSAAIVTAKAKATLDASIGLQLLADIREMFGSHNSIFSRDLIEKLTTDLEKPWAEFRRGKAITQKQLANILRTYGVSSETVWIGDKSAKGYKRTAFEDAWTRFISV